MWVAAKATHSFSAKNFSISAYHSVNFNESLTNDVVYFDQLGPGCNLKTMVWLDCALILLQIPLYTVKEFHSLLTSLQPMSFCLLFYKSVYSWYWFELLRQVKAIQIITSNICFYKENQEKLECAVDGTPLKIPCANVGNSMADGQVDLLSHTLIM